MPLHSKDDINDDALSDIYASSDLGQVMPKYKMPEKEHDPRHAFAVVRERRVQLGQSMVGVLLAEMQAAMGEQRIVGGDENPDLSLAEPVQGTGPRRLALVPVEGRARDPGLLEPGHHLVRHVLHLGEHDDLPHRAIGS